MWEPCVLLKYGEMTLKGRNRARFENRLLANLRHTVAGIEGVTIRRRSSVLVASAPDQHDELLTCARQLLGISLVQSALRVPKTLEAAAAAAVQVARAQQGGRSTPTFAVRARRRHKEFPLRSTELAAQIGTHIQHELGWPVNLSHPDVEIAVEVDHHEILVSGERYPGQGGLPVGVSGYGLVLLSGGFDSPVAAYRAMRRGLRCDFVHFSGAPFTGPSSTYKAYALVRQLGQFHTGARLHVVSMGEQQRALATAGAGELQIVAQRRLMVRVADRIAQQHGAQALVTGDNLGQVSSQTLANLTAVEEAATLPMLRPLLGWDKPEIIAEAERIGTADISKLPDEDCCSLLMPPRVTTRATLAQLATLERRIPLDDLADQLVDKVRVMEVNGSAGSRGGDLTHAVR